MTTSKVIYHGDEIVLTPEEMWERFIARIDHKDGFKNTNFLGSVESYKKDFLAANNQPWQHPTK